MKSLALLLLALPLAACASTPQKIARADHVPINSLIARPSAVRPVSKLSLQYIAEAETRCRASNIGSSDPQFGLCVNDYLSEQHGILAFRDRAGAIEIASVASGWPSPDATEAFAVWPGPGSSALTPGR